MSKSSSSSSGVGVLGLLGVAFVVLKLTGVINWSWWWVTCPFWAVAAIALILIGGGILIYLFKQLFKRKKK
jgi:membrane protein YdbS with pleckstrin-like domain